LVSLNPLSATPQCRSTVGVTSIVESLLTLLKQFY
jgi:hypothetical protein